jgi:hypothetical protein
MTDNRKYLPSSYQDESIPAPRPHPSDWIKGPTGDLWELFSTDENDPEADSIKVAPGDIVAFQYCIHYGYFELTVNSDGTYSLENPIPEEAEYFRIWFDSDTLSESIEDLIANSDLTPGDKETVEAYYWSPDERWALVVGREGARFEKAEP